MLRAMWRCETCDISCASTEASSSRVDVIAIRPRCTPTKPPGSAKALTLGSRTRNGSQAKRWSRSAVMLPSERDGGDERLPERLQVLEQQRVVEVVGIDADLAHDLVADLALGADGEVGRVGIAERGQLALRARRRPTRPGRQRERAGEQRGDDAAPERAARRPSMHGTGSHGRQRRCERGRRAAALSPRMMQRKHFSFVIP